MKSILVLILVLALVLIAVACFFPIEATTGYECPYCGACARRTRYLFVSMPLDVYKEGLLTRYWRAHVEANHKHTWIARCTNENWGTGHSDHSGNFARRWQVEDRMMIAVLESLPNPKARKTFLTRLWHGETSANAKVHCKAEALIMLGIRHSYLEDPGRNDWPKILKSYGYWPGP